MYVREKKIRRRGADGEKVYSYWQLVRGTRVEGKVRQKVVAHIGVAEDRERADAYARMKGLLCGVLGCGNAAVEEPEMEGYLRPTQTVKLPDGGEKECSYLFCADHVAAWRDGETVRAYALI